MNAAARQKAPLGLKPFNWEPIASIRDHGESVASCKLNPDRVPWLLTTLGASDTVRHVAV